MAGSLADVATLNAAHAFGFVFDGAALARGVAASGSHSKMLWFCEQQYPLPADVSISVARSGNVDLLRWLKQEHNVRLCPDAMRYAAPRGHLHMCQYLRGEQCPWDNFSLACYGAARYGWLDTLRWLFDNGCPQDAVEVSAGAGRSGSTDIMEFWLQRAEGDAAEMLAAMLDGAGLADQLAAAQWARARGAEWPGELRWRCTTLAWPRDKGCTPVTDWAHL
jgi:hypothetical protein